jgi:hypothetical protein
MILDEARAFLRDDSMMAASSAWFLGILTLLISIPNVFGSKETLARNSKLIGTQNLVVARAVCVIGLLAGCMLVLVAVFFTYHSNAIFSAGGLLATLVIAFFAYCKARADVAKIAKANEDGSPKG